MARRRGKVNVKNQVDQALKKINKLGESKKALRDAKQQTGIHSRSQIDHAYSVNMQFVKWAKENHGIKDIYQLKRVHYRDYIAAKKQEGVSKGHLINIETNLRLLSKGMDQISAGKGFKAREWVPKERMIHSSEREKARDRSYTRQEITKVREHLPEGSKRALDLQNAFGLRLREVSNMKGAHIVEKGGRLYFKAVGDKRALNTAKGVTKAARERLTPCLPGYEARVREIIAGKASNEYLAPKYNTNKSAYSRAAAKASITNYTGSHGFRHTYARVRLRDMLRTKGIYKEGCIIIDRMVANYENNVRKDTGILRSERALYKTVNECIDKVHSELGHGKGRMDLVAVYMR